MTTIKQLLEMPIGQKTGGYDLSIKTFKKNWQVDTIWWSQVIFMDGTGEIPADVKIGTKYNPLRGRVAERIHIIVAEVQEAEYLGKDRKKLVVDQFSIPSITVDEYDQATEDWNHFNEEQIKGKIRHGLSCSYIEGCAYRTGCMAEPTSEATENILKWQDFIVTGE
jgi:hypothetical protein